MDKFEIGDKVKLITRYWGDWEGNPVWDGEYGKIEGTIIGFHENTRINSDEWIDVNWSNGHKNSYHAKDLEIIKKAQPTVYGIVKFLKQYA
jgi:hypothetical protein